MSQSDPSLRMRLRQLRSHWRACALTHPLTGSSPRGTLDPGPLLHLLW
eukprot:CAMPEP_0173276972 /NCGR_PEP_ID=MMETSP1143-20121109/3820_1 /TAXON_ID=483371 /ORGANISM="non described non described, Strain CCMP2298" /LENGTH=47 /DNA_ID= /DNA_START= /DNA_END= /DNA_ORIENTATION=